MTRTTLISILSIAAASAASPALAQLSISWSTIDGGGGTTSAGAYTVNATIGQPDAGVMSGGSLVLTGGFWGAAVSTPCYANCDNSTAAPVLNVNDFICFQSRFAAGDAYANCDGSTAPPILNVNDFICFQARFAAGCP
jgi:hypothetical protein